MKESVETVKISKDEDLCRNDKSAEVASGAQTKSSFKGFEAQVENYLDRLFTNETFLSMMAMALNINSARKVFIKKTMHSLWKSMQLPNKVDQDRTIYMVNELQFRLAQMEERLMDMQKEKGEKNRSQAKTRSKANNLVNTKINETIDA